MANQQPLVSVIMNCYNSHEYLREAIESVMAQTYSNWELIFWDNQSTDASAAIFQEHRDPRLRYFLADRHTTLGEARELASLMVNGEWLAFLDCDDIWLPRKLELQVNTINDKKNAPVFVYSRTRLLVQDSTGDTWKVARGAQGIYENQSLPENDIFGRLIDDMFTLFPSVLIRTEDYISVGGIDPGFKQAEDLDLVLRLAQRGPVAVVQECCCYYRIHTNNLTKSQRELIYTETIQAMKKLGQSALVKGAIRRTYVRYFLHLLFRNRDVIGALKLAKMFNPKDVAVVLYDKFVRRLNAILTQ